MRRDDIFKLTASLIVVTVLGCSDRTLASARAADSSGPEDAILSGMSAYHDGAAVQDHAEATIREGRRIFRFDTFGDEAFWGGVLGLHQAIEGSALGGVGPG